MRTRRKNNEPSMTGIGSGKFGSRLAYQILEGDIFFGRFDHHPLTAIRSAFVGTGGVDIGNILRDDIHFLSLQGHTGGRNLYGIENS